MKNNLNSVIIEGIMANRRRAGYKDAVAFDITVFGVNNDKTTRVDVITCEAFSHWAGVVAGLDAEAVRDTIEANEYMFDTRTLEIA